MTERDSLGENQAEYKARILSYQAGQDPFALLESAPSALSALVSGLSETAMLHRPAPGKWCIKEIVAHLADDELVGAYRIRLILSAPGTPIQAFDQDRWARTGRYTDIPLSSSLDLFATLRSANVWLLKSLTEEEWVADGIHAERGAESIRDIAMYYAGHDINHFKQIEALSRGAE